MPNAKIQKYKNTNTQIQKYTNTLNDQVLKRPNMWYIFEKRIDQKSQKRYFLAKQAPKLQTFAAAPRVECTQTSCAETEVQVLQKKTIILLHTCV